MLINWGLMLYVLPMAYVRLVSDNFPRHKYLLLQSYNHEPNTQYIKLMVAAATVIDQYEYG